MKEPALAIAVSPRQWPERLHAYLADHGGARVRVRILRPDDALTESFDVLLIDDTCSFLTRRLVHDVRSLGRVVIGVFDHSEHPDGRELLQSFDVDAVIESSVTPEEVLITLAGLALSIETGPEPDVGDGPARPTHSRIVVGGPPGGVGATEVAIGLATSLSEWDPVLVDLDDQSPSMAARLGLSLHPNLPSAVDAFLHQEGDVHDQMQLLEGSGIRVIAGLPRRADWSTVRPYAVMRLCRFLADRFPLILNIGSDIGEVPGEGRRTALARETLLEADVIVAVGASSPVGVVRLLDWLADLRAVGHPASLNVILNQAPASSYKRSQLIAQIKASLNADGVDLLPYDKRVAASAWEGVAVGAGPFARRISQLSSRIAERFVA